MVRTLRSVVLGDVTATPFELQTPTVTQRAISILRRYGTNAHVYLPGIGTINGLTAGNYLLSDGSTGATPVDGLVGLDLDAAGSVGAELNPYPGGPFTATTGYSVIGTGGAVALVSGELELTATAGNFPGLRRAITTVIGSTYCVTVVARRGTTASNIRITVSGSSSLIDGSSTSNTTLTQYFTATATTTNIDFSIPSAAASGTAYLVSESIKEVTGTHATAAGAARPTLRRGLVNLLQQSSAPSAAPWTANGSIAAVGNTITDSGSADEFIFQAVTISAGTDPYTCSARIAKTVTAKYAALFIDLTGGTSVYAGVVINLMTGASTGNGVGTQTVIDDGDAWLVAKTLTTNSNTSLRFRIYAAYNDNGSAIRNGATQGSSNWLSMGAFTGTYTAAQILAEGGIPLTTTAAASNATAGRYSAQYSGAQSLALGSVPFQRTDDVFIIAASKNDATAATKIFSSRGATVNPLIELIENATGGFTYQYRDDAGTIQARSSVSNYIGSFAVVTGYTVSNSAILRVNGVAQSAPLDISSISATTLTNSMIGACAPGGVAQAYFTGSIGPIIIGKGTVTDADLLTLERFVSSMTPNGPSF